MRGERIVEHSNIEPAVISDASNQSGVSWGAVIAGAFAAAALSFALLALGAGVGFSEVSPWRSAGETYSRIGWTAVVWLVLMQIISSSVGGYLAGRLRTRWVHVHDHEIYFRDTAHGFLVWAVSLVMAVAFLASAASIAGRSGRHGAATADDSGAGQRQGNGAYFVDLLLRSNASNSGADVSSLRPEIGRILANGIRERSLPAADKSYLVQVVQARSGVSQPEAEKTVDDVFGRLQASLEHARKAVAHSMYWTFLALLAGAFCASFAATIGGEQRDRVLAV
jgi:hypothetical protein